MHYPFVFFLTSHTIFNYSQKNLYVMIDMDSHWFSALFDGGYDDLMNNVADYVNYGNSSINDGDCSDNHSSDNDDDDDDDNDYINRIYWWWFVFHEFAKLIFLVSSNWCHFAGLSYIRIV